MSYSNSKRLDPERLLLTVSQAPFRPKCTRITLADQTVPKLIAIDDRPAPSVADNEEFTLDLKKHRKNLRCHSLRWKARHVTAQERDLLAHQNSPK
jgi:hypothetical protein